MSSVPRGFDDSPDPSGPRAMSRANYRAPEPPMGHVAAGDMIMDAMSRSMGGSALVPDSRSTSAPGESRNAHFGDAAAKSRYQAPHGFDVRAWINDADPIDEARGRYRDEDYDVDLDHD